MKLKRWKWNAKWLKYKAEKRQKRWDQHRWSLTTSWLILRIQQTKRPSMEEIIEFLHHHRCCFVYKDRHRRAPSTACILRFKEITMQNHSDSTLISIELCVSEAWNSIGSIRTMYVFSICLPFNGHTSHFDVICRWQKQYSSVVLPLFRFDLNWQTIKMKNENKILGLKRKIFLVFTFTRFDSPNSASNFDVTIWFSFYTPFRLRVSPFRVS